MDCPIVPQLLNIIVKIAVLTCLPIYGRIKIVKIYCFLSKEENLCDT